MQNLVMNLLIDFLMIGSPFAYCRLKGKHFLREIGISRLHFVEGIKKSLALLVSLLIVSFLLSTILTLLQANDLEKVHNEIKQLKEQGPLLLVYLLIVRVVSEEIFFRGFLVKKLGALPATAAFAIAHAMYNSFAELIGAFVLGYLLAIVYERNKNLLPNIVAHVLYNVIIIAAVM